MISEAAGVLLKGGWFPFISVSCWMASISNYHFSWSTSWGAWPTLLYCLQVRKEDLRWKLSSEVPHFPLACRAHQEFFTPAGLQPWGCIHRYQHVPAQTLAELLSRGKKLFLWLLSAPVVRGWHSFILPELLFPTLWYSDGFGNILASTMSGNKTWVCLRALSRGKDAFLKF